MEELHEEKLHELGISVVQTWRMGEVWVRCCWVLREDGTHHQQASSSHSGCSVINNTICNYQFLLSIIPQIECVCCIQILIHFDVNLD